MAQKKPLKGEKNTHSGVADFDNEVGEPEAFADGSSGGRHMAWEPVDDPAAGVEPHLRDPLGHSWPPTHRLATPLSSLPTALRAAS